MNENTNQLLKLYLKMILIKTTKERVLSGDSGSIKEVVYARWGNWEAALSWFSIEFDEQYIDVPQVYFGTLPG